MNNLLKNYFSPTPKRIQRWLFGIKSVIATAAATAFVGGNDKWAFYAMVTGAILGELGNLFSEDQTN